MKQSRQQSKRFLTFLKAKRVILLILLLGLTIRIILFLVIMPWDSQALETRILVSDAIEYQRIATDLLMGRSYDSVGTFRTPGYPTFLALIYFFVGARPWAALLIQCLLGLFTIVLVYWLGREVFDKRVGAIAGILVSVDPHTNLYSLWLFSDTFFVVLFLGSFFALIWGLKRNFMSSFGLGGFLLALATLVRPISQFFPLLCIGSIILFPWATWRRKLTAISIFLLMFLVGLSPWLWRNQSKYGHLALSTVSSYNLLFWNVVYTESLRTGKPYEEVAQKYRDSISLETSVSEKNPFQTADTYANMAKTYLVSNLSYYLMAHGKGMVMMFAHPDTKQISSYLGWSTSLNVGLQDEFIGATNLLKFMKLYFYAKPSHEILIALMMWIVMGFYYATFFAGLYFLMKSGNHYYPMFLISVIIYFCFLTGPVGNARYKLPIIPFYSVISATGITCWFTKRKREQC